MHYTLKLVKLQILEQHFQCWCYSSHGWALPLLNKLRSLTLCHECSNTLNKNIHLQNVVALLILL